MADEIYTSEEDESLIFDDRSKRREYKTYVKKNGPTCTTLPRHVIRRCVKSMKQHMTINAVSINKIKNVFFLFACLFLFHKIEKSFPNFNFLISRTQKRVYVLIFMTL